MSCAPLLNISSVHSDARLWLLNTHKFLHILLKDLRYHLEEVKDFENSLYVPNLRLFRTLYWLNKVQKFDIKITEASQ